MMTGLTKVITFSAMVSNVNQGRYYSIKKTIPTDSNCSEQHLVLTLLGMSLLEQEGMQYVGRISRRNPFELCVDDLTMSRSLGVSIGQREFTDIKKLKHKAQNLCVIAPHDEDWICNLKQQLQFDTNTLVLTFDALFIKELQKSLSRHIRWHVYLEDDVLTVSFGLTSLSTQVHCLHDVLTLPSVA